MKLVAASLVLVATAAASVRAEPAPGGDEHRDPRVAVALSLGGTLLPLAALAAAPHLHDATAEGVVAVTMGVGLWIGPSLGHWYAGDAWTTGLALRLGAAVVGLTSDAVVNSCWNGCSDEAKGAEIVTAGLFVAGAAWDLATAGRAARRFNAAHVQVAPVPLATPGGTALGLGVGGSF